MVQNWSVLWPVTLGRKKYAQNTTISSGVPRTTYTSAVIGQRTMRQGEMRAMPSSSPSGSDSSRPMTARINVSARPPSGPLGYCPTRKYSQ
ncbi:hypothetical protein D3C71_1962630 [compost metagenome]